MSLSHRDYQNLLEFCGTVHSIANRNDLLQAVCQWLQESLRIRSAVLVPANPQTGEFQFQHNFLFNNEPNVFVQYVSHYAQLDPLATNRWIWRYDNSAARYSDFIAQTKLAETEFGRDFLPQIPLFHCLCSTLCYQGDPVGALGLHRKKLDGAFSDREKEMLRLLAPHLSQALHNISLVETIAAAQGIGMIFVGAERETLYMNEEARRALNGRPLSDIPDAGLSPKGIFFHAQAKTYRVRSVPLTCITSNLVANTGLRDDKPTKRTTKIILLEPCPSACILKTRLSRFGLSPRQEEIAVLIMQGIIKPRHCGATVYL